jgi:hypothetical protein
LTIEECREIYKAQSQDSITKLQTNGFRFVQNFQDPDQRGFFFYLDSLPGVTLMPVADMIYYHALFKPELFPVPWSSLKFPTLPDIFAELRSFSQVGPHVRPIFRPVATRVPEHGKAQSLVICIDLESTLIE